MKSSGYSLSSIYSDCSRNGGLDAPAVDHRDLRRENWIKRNGVNRNLLGHAKRRKLRPVSLRAEEEVAARLRHSPDERSDSL